MVRMTQPMTIEAEVNDILWQFMTLPNVGQVVKVRGPAMHPLTASLTLAPASMPDISLQFLPMDHQKLIRIPASARV